MPESALAHRLLDELFGIEIGGSAQNPFGLVNCINVDFTDDMNTVFKREERDTVGFALPVDVVARGDALPFEDEALDYVLTSHVLEHFWDPIAALEEWLRVVRPGGFIYMIVPHKERTFDVERSRTPLAELLARHAGEGERPTREDEADGTHWSVWITEDVVELCRHLGLDVVAVQDVDDKVGNGFTVVVKKEGVLTARRTNSLAPTTLPPLDLGCGEKKRLRHLGVDRAQFPGVDVVWDLTSLPLPFPDDSVMGVYSNFLFQELADPSALLREIVRVAKHGSDVHIWTPHGRDLRSFPAALSAYNDTIWAQLLAQVDSPRGRLVWEHAWYIVPEQTQAALAARNIPLGVAISTYSDIVKEYGVLLRVDKRRSYLNTVTARSAGVKRVMPEAV